MADVMVKHYILMSRDSPVGIVTGYGLDNQEVGVRVPVGSRIFTLHVVQTSSGVHPTSYTMSTGGCCPGVKRPGRDASHSPPTSAEVKKIHSPIRLHGVVLNELSIGTTLPLRDRNSPATFGLNLIAI
jgi:hypothetical protein